MKRSTRGAAPEPTTPVLESIEAAVLETGDPHATRTYYDTDPEWHEVCHLADTRMVAVVAKGKTRGQPAWIEVQLTRNGVRALETA